MRKTLYLLIMTVLAQPFYAQKETYRFLIGTYTNSGKSQGIYSYEVDMKTAIFTQKAVATGISNPSYLAFSPDKKYVYAVSESGNQSTANAFSFDKNTAKLTLINSSLTKGQDPCFITVTNKHVFTANYSGGSVSVFGRKPNGSLTNDLQIIQHSGKSIIARRQDAPHVHQTMLSPDGRYMLVNDLGTDQVTSYKYSPNAASEILTPWDTLSVKPGSGPRHTAFSKNGKRLYVVHEIDGTLSVLAMEKGKLSLIQETSVVRKDDIKAASADIHLSPDGKFLYATNRGPANDITCFSVSKNGKLEFRQQIPTGGDGPRNFAITPDGKYVFVAHQRTDNIVIFKRDAKTGILTPTGKQIEVGAPVCLVFY